MAYSEGLSTPLNPVAERTCFSQVYTRYSSCHDTVWMDDALEFMVYPHADSADPAGNYTEIDLSPRNALW